MSSNQSELLESFQFREFKFVNAKLEDLFLK